MLESGGRRFLPQHPKAVTAMQAIEYPIRRSSLTYRAYRLKAEKSSGFLRGATTDASKRPRPGFPPKARDGLRATGCFRTFATAWGESYGCIGKDGNVQTAGTVKSLARAQGTIRVPARIEQCPE